MERTAGGNTRRRSSRSLSFCLHTTDLRFGCTLMLQAYNAGKSGGWANYLEVFLGNGKLSEWASAKVRECYNDVEQEDEDRPSIARTS